MRTDEDALRLSRALEDKRVKSAVVVGASMVGIKVAELLAKRGIRTVLADLASCMFPLAAYEDVAAEIGRRVEQKGVSLRFGRTIERVELEAGEAEQRPDAACGDAGEQRLDAACGDAGEQRPGAGCGDVGEQRPVAGCGDAGEPVSYTHLMRPTAGYAAGGRICGRRQDMRQSVGYAATGRICGHR